MPLLIDLCCGLGGWSVGFLERGWECWGYDVEPLPYPGRLTVCDVRTLSGGDFRHARLIVASPPCQEFSRHSMPWTRAKNPPPPDLSIVEACYRIAREAAVPLVMENVRGSQKWLGRAIANYGSRYLWGDGVPAIIPTPGRERLKESLSSKSFRERAVIPIELSRWMAAIYTNSI